MRRHSGFSLTETLLAIGTLAIGMLFIGGTFLAGIHFTTIATERTIAAVAADEAFAKVRLYGLDVADPNLGSGTLVPFGSLAPITADEMAYPSTGLGAGEKQYHWSALCRVADPNSQLVQVTVFVSRRIGAGRYWRRNIGDWPDLVQVSYPRPVLAEVAHDSTRPAELLIADAVPGDTVAEMNFVNDGYKIVDSQTGLFYRVLERYTDEPNRIRLDVPWQGSATSRVWVVPAPVNGGRNPCIAVYQRVIRL
ncbi:MAG: hypothetical protein JSU70_23690 [Phycisphaerales bacterium]|nr:MAG: hypothetical protein JSU70_23690 [Phycisphaerales bacterium]